MLLDNKIKLQLKNEGIDFTHFVDISYLSKEQTKGFSAAILFGIVLSPAYLQKVSETSAYVEKMKQTRQIQNDEFHLTELKTDRIADKLANYLLDTGFKAYSQSEANIEKTGFYNKLNNSTPLPHKTIARLAGMGWIGKHNLLVTPQFGSATSMCTVLTNAPVKTIRHTPSDSKCGKCTICIETCPTNALSGKNWNKKTTRDNLLNYKKCTTCLECMVHCPWTQKYIQINLTEV